MMVQQKELNERIPLIDILRGFTLAGIIMVHFVEQYYAGLPPRQLSELNSQIWNQIISGLVSLLITGKFFMIFSFLFGLSFYLQLSKSDSSPSFYVRFFWRLVILFTLGVIHNLHYRGDILTVYAVLGVGLILLHRLPDKILLILALAFIVDLPSFMIRGAKEISEVISASAPNQNPFGMPDEATNQKYFEILKGHSYLNILKANFKEFATKVDFQVSSGRAYITLGLFLLGLYAGRKKFFENAFNHLSFVKRAMKVSSFILLGTILFIVCFFGGAQLLNIKLPSLVSWMVGGLAYDTFNACLAMIYTGVIIRMFYSERWKKRIVIFFEPGRMGLTTYLMQTMFGFLIFYGFGLGLLAEVGAALSILIGLTVFVIQVIFSRWWLKNFNYGPFEWLWRSLTYLKLQPFFKVSS